MAFYKRKIGGIYKIENAQTGKIYIGLSVDIFSRWSSHYTSMMIDKHSSPALTKAFLSSQISDWTFTILEYVSKTEYKRIHGFKGKELDKMYRRHLIQKERHHMSLYSINDALNKDNRYFS